MDCIIEDSPNMMGGVVYLGLDTCQHSLRSTQIEPTPMLVCFELLSSRLNYVPHKQIVR